MNFRNLIYILCIYFVFSNFLFAVDIKFLNESFKSKYEKIKSLECELTIETYDKNDEMKITYCKYYYEEPSKFYKKLKNETSENITISDGRKIRFIYPEVDIKNDFLIEEIDTNTLEKIYLQNLIVNYLNFSFLEKNFNIKEIQETEKNYKINLMVKNNNFDINSVFINLNKETLLPENILFFYTDISGDFKANLIFNEIKINKEFDKKIFQIN